jgi:RimJ/RimL family protein N-acetyltransferase
MRICFPTGIQIPVWNWFTGAKYILRRSDEIEPSPSHASQIVSIGNEPDVYKWLFQAVLEGKPYPREMAVAWLAWSSQGWREQSHFVFVVTTESNEIVAGCDIEINNENQAEIGYWSSQRHRGVMTHTVKEVCNLARHAGFRVLFARTQKANLRSSRVLERVGFESDSARSAKDDTHDWFSLSLDDAAEKEESQQSNTIHDRKS